METLLSSLRISVATMAICVGGYTGAVWAVGQAVAPELAEGSLVTGPDGRVIGSRQIAQAFTQAKYVWPRPSAVDYKADAAGGSNKSPTSTDLTDRAAKTVAAFGATSDRPLPADLAAASGGGLDPHISERAARYQAARVAAARGVPVERVDEVIDSEAFAPGGVLTPERVVNVLALNLALDRELVR